jgi:hypothetical protein
MRYETRFITQRLMTVGSKGWHMRLFILGTVVMFLYNIFDETQLVMSPHSAKLQTNKLPNYRKHFRVIILLHDADFNRMWRFAMGA